MTDQHETITQERDRLRVALEHIASGGMSPALGFARSVLDGATASEAHASEVIRREKRDGLRCKTCSRLYAYTSPADWDMAPGRRPPIPGKCGGAWFQAGTCTFAAEAGQ